MHKFYWNNVSGSSRSVHSGEGDRPPYPPYPAARGNTQQDHHQYQVSYNSPR